MFNVKDPTLKRASLKGQGLCPSCVDESTLKVVGTANMKRRIVGLGQQGHVSTLSISRGPSNTII